jgi:hypothetical protein
MDEAIGAADRVVRAVDEAGLDIFPGRRVAVARVAIERPDVERRAALLAIGELVLGVPAFPRPSGVPGREVAKPSCGTAVR